MNVQAVRTVLITGSGSGLGEAMARRFAGAGYRIAVCDIDRARAIRVHEEVERLAPGSMALEMDIRDQAAWDQAHERVLSQWGGLQVLVNNAGVAAAGSCAETSMEDWEWVVETDLMGVVRGCHRFVPTLEQTANQGVSGCHVVNVASFAGLAGLPGIAAYGTAKAAVVALSEQLRAELHYRGVGVSVVCPAFVKTRLLENFRSTDPAARSWVSGKMARSAVSADDVARMTLEAMRARRFMVLTHSYTRTAWRLKRWLPELYFRRVSKADNRGNRAIRGGSVS